MAKTLKELVNNKFTKLQHDLVRIKQDEECIEEEKRQAEDELNNIKRNQREIKKYKKIMAATLACGIGIGLIELMVLDKIREKKLYHSYIEIYSEEDSYTEEDYIDKIKAGEATYLIHYEPWQEKPIYNIFGRFMAMSYEKNTLVYDVSNYDYELMRDYLAINPYEENIKGEIIDTQTRYILPDDDKTIWEVRKITQPDLDWFITINQPLEDYEKGLFTLVFSISLLVPCAIILYLYIIIKMIMPDIRVNKKVQQQLLVDLEVLNNRLSTVLLDKEEIIKEINTIKDKYQDLIEDKDMNLNRKYNNSL